MMRNLYVLVIFILFFSAGAFAGEVTKVNGGKALLELKGEAAAVGDMFYTIGADGKRHGIVQVTKVSGDKAIVKIAKGKVEVGMTLERRAAAGAAAAEGGKRTKRGNSNPGSRSYWGGMVGYSMDKMDVSVNKSTPPAGIVGKPSLSGSAFSAMALFDYELFPQIWFRGLGGLEGFSAAGASICGTTNTDACNASIYYLSMDFMARYVFAQGSFRPWLGLGIGLMFPASKSATALDTNSISNTSVIQVAGGFDYFISPNLFIPVSIEYGLLPKSNDVDASWMEFRVGVGVPF